MMGERPAISSSGTRSRAALASRLMVFAVPTLTCTITACGCPVARWAPWAMAMARFSWGTKIDRGNAAPLERHQDFAADDGCEHLAAALVGDVLKRGTGSHLE